MRPTPGPRCRCKPSPVPGPVVAIRQVLPRTVDGLRRADTVMGNVTVPRQYAGTIAEAAANNGIPAALLAALV